MRVEFIVTAAGEGWSVRRGGSMIVSSFETQERALAAAERFAQSAAADGNKAVVKVAEGAALQEHRSFAPARFERLVEPQPGTPSSFPSRPVS